jgi:guanylate kinase
MTNKKRGNLFIISGPSGAGKGTLRNVLFQEMSDLVFSVSCTTRKIRSGEVDGRDYYFIDKEQFGRMIANNDFIEWAEVHGNYYGTKKKDVETCLDLNCDMVLEIDMQGSRQVKLTMPEAIRIFITVQSIDELEHRLNGRGSNTKEQMMLRLRNAAAEMRYAAECEHVVVNDDIVQASRELIDIVKSYRCNRGNHP